MNHKRPIKIIGGGLAGLALGIALRQREVPVEIWEAGGYPRHRVCGEFISGAGQAVLERLGLREKIVSTGSTWAETALFASGSQASLVHRLPQPALCVSRFVLDHALAREFESMGGKLRANERCPQEGLEEGWVRASGRRPQPVENGWRWFGLKIHASRVPLAADLEMHLLRNAYVGICKLPGGQVNICGLFRRPPNEHPAGKAAKWEALRGPAGSLLRSRIEAAQPEESSFCSVAGLSLRAHRASDWPECSIGDALTMTPPVSGNGMSMALEAAEIAAESLAMYSQACLSWAEAKHLVADRCDERFTNRLRWARVLQLLLFTPLASPSCLRFAFASRFLWNAAFARTR
ncbi:MAG TPA: hypothetical protein VHH88_10045 [Verrucomicrobiae bacterium]|nr:hypothetical protein [Verrucomicrobiae bacterium]